ncbi:MAG: nuclear transport factor 2 family protein, partial [Candidatus Acidiferrum sp.]
HPNNSLNITNPERGFSVVLEERMKYKLLLLVGACLACAICAARAQESSTADAERYIKESERLWAESVATGDTSGVQRFLADDFLGVDTDGSLYGKAKAIADTHLGAKEFVSNHLTEVKMRFYGDAAVAQGSESWVRRSGTLLRGRYVWTDTWIKRNGNWQIVAAEDLIVPETGR